MEDYFKQLEEKLDTFRAFSKRGGLDGFFGQEVLRFYSIAGTLFEIFTFHEEPTVDERYITFTLSRSLIENYFRLIYLYDKPDEKQARYNDMVNSFKRDYHKLYNDKDFPHPEWLESPEDEWSGLPRGMDLNSMLAQFKNDNEDRRTLYDIYRIASFGTHGNNLENVFQESFGKQVNFPILNIGRVLQGMANQYLSTLKLVEDES